MAVIGPVDYYGEVSAAYLREKGIMVEFCLLDKFRTYNSLCKSGIKVLFREAPDDEKPNLSSLLETIDMFSSELTETNALIAPFEDEEMREQLSRDALSQTIEKTKMFHQIVRHALNGLSECRVLTVEMKVNLLSRDEELPWEDVEEFAREVSYLLAEGHVMTLFAAKIANASMTLSGEATAELPAEASTAELPAEA